MNGHALKGLLIRSAAVLRSDLGFLLACDPKKEQEDLKNRFDATIQSVKKNKQLWQDPKKKKKLQSLLTQLEKLIEI